MAEVEEIQKATTTEELDSLVKRYLDLKADWHRLNNAAKELPKPPAVNQVSSLEELYAYDDKLKKYEATKRALEDEREGKFCQLSALEKAIIKSLPIKGVWVRVGKYAVGYYYDVWGGGHFVLSIKEWAEDLPNLIDQTYYP